MNMLAQMLVVAGAVFLLARFLPGIVLRRKSTTLVVALVFGVSNLLLGWAVKMLLWLPVVLSFGLLYPFVTLITNTLMLWLTDKLVDAFEIKNGKTLLIASATVTAANWIAAGVLR